MESMKRQTAKKTDIKSIMLGKYIKEEGWTPNYVLTDNNRHLSRVNVMGVVVGKNEDDNSITLDDGTASTVLRTFESITLFSKINIGDSINVIGRPREFNNDKYIIAEIAKKIDKKWLEVRNQELEHIEPEKEPEKPKEVIVDEVVISNDFEKLTEKLRELDSGNGVDTEKLIALGFDEDSINKLIENGEIFEVSPGILKVLE